jgi:thymidylate kinase
MNTTDFIINIGLYLFIGLWTFINNLQYKKNTILLLDNNHNDLIEKIKKLGFKISELELQNKIRKIKLEEEYREIKELEQMKIEDSNTVKDVVKDVVKDLVKELDTDIIDLSEEIYPSKNLNQNIQNKKGWLKTLLFM